MRPGVWFLFTAREASRAEAVVAACTVAGTSQEVRVVRDDDRRGLGLLMQETFEAEPDLAFYGWLADDTFPHTEGWDLLLSEAAGDWFLSYADDGGYQDPAYLASGAALSSGLCWGGELVRTVGWWALPGLTSAWIDLAWQEIVRPLGIYNYQRQVLVRHDHWRTGRREADSLDEASAEQIETDRTFFSEWQQREAPGVVRRVAVALVDAGCPLYAPPVAMRS